MDQKSNRKLFLAISILFNLLIGVVVIWVVSRTSILFKGSDSMYHIYRGDWILGSIESGDAWPLYNPVWYNGVELMRYWPPVAAYLMAFCQFIARSLPVIFPANYIFEGFAVYCGFIYFIGAITWNIVGYIKNRPVFGAVIGALWFFMPQSIYVLFTEGNLPRSLIMAVFPLAFVFINEYLKKGGIKNFIGTALTFFFMCACHVGYTGMVAIACLIYMFVYRLCCFTGSGRLQHSGKRDFELIAAIISGFLLSGIFLLPALKGGLASNTSSAGQAAETFFQSIFVTLNPVGKLKDGYEVSYFGIVCFILALFGAVASKKRARAGFITAVIIVLLTSKTAAPVIKMLPGGSLMWMLRFLQIAQAMILYSMLEWDSLKKPVTAVATILVTVECALSASTYALVYDEDENIGKSYFEDLSAYTLIDEAKSLTTNRIALIDSNKPLVNGVFYLTDYEGESVSQLFGQGWEAASTATQIAQINESFDQGYYYFMFDRLLEYGCDTVLIKKDAAMPTPYNEVEAEAAATLRGYEKVYDEGLYAVYHYDVEGAYGTVATYNGIAIGNGAYYISMMFPTVCEAPSEYIDDFTLEELSSYEYIYLDGFLYHDVEAAEDLITKAAEAGSKVYVLADGIPENEQSRTYRFLGVECQSVEFDNGFPELKTKELGDFEIALFPNDMRQWKTVYINGLTEVLGYSEVLGEQLPFWGKGENENITFIGYNLTYYYALTRDRFVGQILAGIVDTSETEVPDRKIVPLDITYGENKITIVSPEDNVNTNVADHDIFEGNYSSFNHLVFVDSGTTEITYGYPYMLQGALMSFVGILLAGISVIYLRRKGRRGNI